MRPALRPAIHVSAPRGWLNDPNGLCRQGDVWHAFYQHDPNADTHGLMHWGHTSSTDLIRWRDEPVALAPDDLGEVYSGSVVIDEDDTAGFGAGALVAVFTHHLVEDGRQIQRQSLAFSTDGGTRWEKFEGNPVLESDEPDFRDPKVFRLATVGGSVWVMVLTVGDVVQFFRSPDLRTWERVGTYRPPVESTHPLECADLLRLDDGTDPGWLLTVGIVDVGPFGHSGTVGVLGDFDGSRFTPQSVPWRIDHGPDFYAAQSFSGIGGAPVVMGWLNSWRYAKALPSLGRRGTLSLPRRIERAHTSSGSPITMWPAVELRGEVVDPPRWRSEPARALMVAADGDVRVRILGRHGAAATLSIEHDGVLLERHGVAPAHFAQSYRAPIATHRDHVIVIDHGTLEIFASGGASVTSALVLSGRDWSVEVEGDATLVEV
jgi:fructan beta-fructosidase